jgi:hypothetical protein
MRHSKVIGLCLLAMFAIGALTTASASAALPEYIECAKLKTLTGGFNNNTCTEVSATKTGGFEIQPLKKTQKIVTTYATTTLESSAGTVVCKTGAFKGELTPNGLKGVVLRMTVCLLNGKKCKSAGQEKSVVVSNPMVGVLGYLAGKGTGTPTIGVSLKAETGEFSSLFSCEGAEVRTHGTVIGVLAGNINKVSKLSTLKFTQTKGVQEPTSFEGGVAGEDTMLTEIKTTGEFEPKGGAATGLSDSVTVKLGFIEIKA